MFDKMRHGKKNDKGVLESIADALEERISEIKKISEPGERLLAYKTLKETCEASYDREEARSNRRNQEDNQSNGMFLGGMLTGVSGFTGGLVVAVGGFMTAGIAVPLGLAIMALPTATGILAGKKLGSIGYGGEKKQALRIYKMNVGIDKAIESLTSSPNNMQALFQSPHFAEIKATFPDLADEFNTHAERMAARQKLLEGPKPAAPAPKPGPKV